MATMPIRKTSESIQSTGKVKVADGVRDLILYEILDEATEPPTYGKVYEFKGLLRQITSTSSVTTQEIAGDNVTQLVITNTADTTGTLQLVDFPIELKNIVTGDYEDANGVTVPNLGDKPKFGMSAIRTFSNGVRSGRAYYKIQFGDLTGINATTREKGTINPQFVDVPWTGFIVSIGGGMDKPYLEVITDNPKYTQGFLETWRTSFPTLNLATPPPQVI